MSNQEQLKQKIENKQSVKLTDLRETHNPVFKKTDKERGMILTMKKEHNKKWSSLFGTKRPTAGRVSRYFLEMR